MIYAWLIRCLSYPICCVCGKPIQCIPVWAGGKDYHPKCYPGRPK